jgi:tetrahydromethanopterin S-methyltransferase subunit E
MEAVMTTQALVPVNATDRHEDGAALAIGAWIAACVAAGVAIPGTLFLLAAVDNILTGPFHLNQLAQGAYALIVFAPIMIFMIALLTALPWVGLVWLMKLTGLHRGFADIILGAAMGAGLIQIFGAPLFNGGVGLTVYFGVAGAIGGLTYWLVTGRPK